MTTLTIILKVLPYVLCAGIPSFFFIKSAVKKKKEYKEDIESLQALNKKLVGAEKAKGVIRNEHAITEAGIIDDPSVDRGVLPVLSKGIHNHKFSAPCTTSCPAYGRD